YRWAKDAEKEKRTSPSGLPTLRQEPQSLVPKQRAPATLLGGLHAPFRHSAYIAAPAPPASRHSRPFSSPVVAERSAAITHYLLSFSHIQMKHNDLGLSDVCI
ncbi:MAG TPA: hypothetical protein VMR62_15140, partial [Bryobacteraceae bacterium]|nr:hypothetical protein [Bryobacteraceae bacterium]